MNDKMKKTLKKYTKLELATIVAELTDGEDAWDIHQMTGLPTERCEEIVKTGHQIGQALWR
jgi:hypothetical protein